MYFNSKIAIVDDHLEPYVEFPFNELDPPEPDLDAKATEGLTAILRFCWPSKAGVGRVDLKSAFTRFSVLCRAADAGLLDNCSYSELADRLGCTKGNVSKILRELCDHFKVHLGRRSDSGRANMSRARLAQRDAA